MTAAQMMVAMTVPSFNLRRFYLYREADETGVSGIGIVAHGVVFPDGIAVLRWASDRQSTAIYNSVIDLCEIHGHNGKTHLVFLDDD